MPAAAGIAHHPPSPNAAGSPLGCPAANQPSSVSWQKKMTISAPAHSAHAAVNESMNARGDERRA